MKLLLLTLFLFSSLFGDKVLYTSYKETPKRVVKGEIFSIVVKTLSTVENFDDITYKFSKHYGLKLLDPAPKREFIGKYILDKFYFLTTRNSARLPNIQVSIEADIKYPSSYIYGKKLNVIALNPKKDFSNIIANSFELVNYKTTSFDNKYNIVVLVAKATNTDISKLHFKDVIKQGFESKSASHFNSRLTYFVVIDKKLEYFSFSYFNLLTNKFSIITIPILLDDDSVTTQTDLKPQDQSHNKIKAILLAIIVLVLIIFIIIRKKYIYIFLIIFPLAYIIYLLVPSKEICIKKGSQIHLLPVHNGTIFETTKSQYSLMQEGNVDDFIKVKLHNEKIGWVKNEDICKN